MTKNTARTTEEEEEEEEHVMKCDDSDNKEGTIGISVCRRDADRSSA